MAKANDDIEQAMMLAWSRVKRARTRLWTDQMIIGEGLLKGRKWAMRQAKTNKPEGKAYSLAFNEWLKEHNMSDMDGSDRAKLLQIMEERPAIEEYRANVLSPHERATLNNPTAFWRKWKAWGRPKKPKTTGARLRQTNEHLQARITELEEEVQHRGKRIQDLEQELHLLRGEREDSSVSPTAASGSGDDKTEPDLKMVVEH
jgi:hypothetical protein